jgi:glycosyltransferase involved in cell wall biosynthesis
MRVAVYTIALNEEQFVERWYNSAKEADYILIADTGSNDRTVELARSLGIHVVCVGIKPWRFDDARNSALAALPLDIDYCIALDMDEILLPGWREELEKVPEGTTRPRYKYTWSWKPDGSPGLQYGGDKIHARNGYRWKHPVHEVIMAYSIPEVQHWTGLEIHHHPDSTKSRAQYYPMLKMAVDEDPSDDRNTYYYARELFFNQRNQEAAAEFKRHLSLPRAVWPPERASSMRYLAKCEPENAEEWLLKANKESHRRENLVALSQYYYENKEWQKCLEASLKALEVTDKPLDYLCEENAWGEIPWDLAAIASWNLGSFTDALTYGKKAFELSPTNQRLIDNLRYYEGSA